MGMYKNIVRGEVCKRVSPPRTEHIIGIDVYKKLVGGDIALKDFTPTDLIGY